MKTEPRYEVRVTFFGKKFKFQFKEKDSKGWDYDRKPAREDLVELVETMARYHQRSRATDIELAEARRILTEFDYDARSIS